MTTRILVWNAERKSPNGPVGQRVKSRLERFDADVCIVTEADVGLMPSGGHSITCEPMAHGRFREAERKVVMWSRELWFDIMPMPAPNVFSGRAVCATTTTELGPLRVFGVCIPWHDSRVQWPEEKRERWEDHHEFLDLLEPLLVQLDGDGPTVLGGDFNQRVPQYYQPKVVFEHLMATIRYPWEIVTAGDVSGLEGQVIDHLAVNDALSAKSVVGFPATDDDGQRLSDHTGVLIELAVRAGERS